MYYLAPRLSECFGGWIFAMRPLFQALVNIKRFVLRSLNRAEKTPVNTKGDCAFSLWSVTTGNQHSIEGLWVEEGANIFLKISLEQTIRFCALALPFTPLDKSLHFSKDYICHQLAGSSSNAIHVKECCEFWRSKYGLFLILCFRLYVS